MDYPDYTKEIEYATRLSNNDELFEQEFINISKYFPFKNSEVIHGFLSENRGLVVVLNYIKPILKSQVPYAYFHLEMFFDTIFPPHLILVVKALENDFNNRFKKDIRLIDSKILPLVKKLDLGSEFFIWDASFNFKSKNALTLMDLYRLSSELGKTQKLS